MILEVSTPDGSADLIVAENICAVGRPLDYDHPEAHSVVYLSSGLRIAVRETIEWWKAHLG